MKKITLIISAAVLLLYACNNEAKNESTSKDTTTSESTNKAKDEPWVPVDSATMMKAMMEYGTLGPMHSMMASWNGTWNAETTMWHESGKEPEKSNATAVNSMLMGGHYQTSKFTGNMMGMPFEGMSTMAYDNAKKEFVSTWIDNWSTGIMYMSGPWDESSKTMTLTGTMPDICRPGKECKMKETYKIVDDNTHLMEMYGPDPKTGKEFKMMEIKFTRKK